MLLTFTTFANADEGRYNIATKSGDSNYVWILDSEKGKLKYCYKSQGERGYIHCSKWEDIED